MKKIAESLVITTVTKKVMLMPLARTGRPSRPSTCKWSGFERSERVKTEFPLALSGSHYPINPLWWSVWRALVQELQNVLKRLVLPFLSRLSHTAACFFAFPPLSSIVTIIVVSINASPTLKRRPIATARIDPFFCTPENRSQPTLQPERRPLLRHYAKQDLWH